MQQAPLESARIGQAGLAIGVVTETYPPEINGVANTMHHLVEGLAERGHHVRLIRPRQPGLPAQQRTSAITIQLVPGLPIPGYPGLRFGLPVYWRLRRAWESSPMDLVYIATEGPLGHAALAAANALGIPSVTGFHTQFQHYGPHYGLGLFTRQIEETLRQFHNRSDMTLVPTVELRDELSRQGFQNVAVFGRGVDLRLFSPQRRDPELRRTWGGGEDTLILMHVGRLAPEKNLALALRAYATIRATRPETRLVLIGDGPERERIQLDHPEILCLGAKSGEDLARHYASGDLFLFPSLTETYGNVVAEALASGLPVIAFDYAAARSLIRAGHNGSSVPFGDEAAFIAAALSFTHDLERLRGAGARAARGMQASGWESVIEEVESCLYRLVQGRRALASRASSDVSSPSVNITAIDVGENHGRLP
ncbi:MAG: glycosyltransferase family 1 protein [Sphingobacteriia bacterium]|nr:glycosyltransferase family 1 protein [Sphingobacteriia bacterium]NCC38889.1 glycosyltransferase family 1 protein [Gammaproteobacteria bacterium]